MTDFVAIEQALLDLQADIAAQQSTVQALIDAVNTDKGAALGTATLDANSRLQPAQHPALSSGQAYVGSAGNVPVPESLISAIAARSTNLANEPLILDGNGKTPIANLPSSIVTGSRFKGVWDADTNTPDLSVLTPEQGDYYYVNVSGNTTLGSITTWEKSDVAIYDGTSWDRIDGTDAVLSVQGDASTATPQNGIVELSLVDFALIADGIVRGDGSGNAQIETLFSILELIFVGEAFDYYDILFHIYRYYYNQSLADYNTVSTFGSLAGTNKWYGGALAPNGKIYGIPHTSTEILVIDPVSETVSTFGSLAGTAKWIGGVLAPNGKIYGMPYNSTEVLAIDPVSETVSTFGSLTGTAKWIGGVLAPNGKIYGIPYDSTEVLVIDPVSETVSTFGSLAAANKWYGGVLAPNGKIYGIPHTSTEVLAIDPVSETVSTFGSLTGTVKWIGGALAPNGKIYGMPSNSTESLVIDPVSETVSTFGSLAGTNKWYGGVLAPNGKIYGIPHNSTEVLVTGTEFSINQKLPLKPYLNKL